MHSDLVSIGSISPIICHFVWSRVYIRMNESKKVKTNEGKMVKTNEDRKVKTNEVLVNTVPLCTSAIEVQRRLNICGVPER